MSMPGQDTGQPLSVGVADGPLEKRQPRLTVRDVPGPRRRPVCPRGGVWGRSQQTGMSCSSPRSVMTTGRPGRYRWRRRPPNELYARVDGETPGLAHTVAVSTPTPGVCVSPECQASQSQPQDADFEGASADGSRVFFAEHPTNSSPTPRARAKAKPAKSAAWRRVVAVTCLWLGLCGAIRSAPPKNPRPKNAS